MMQRFQEEWKIAGSGLYLVSASFTAALILLALAAGDLLDVGSIGFEVLFPFFAAIAVGEWGKTRADGNFDAIAAQSKSLFPWVLIRYLAIMGAVSVFAVAGMAAIFFLRSEMPVWELLLTYFPTAFFLSSLSAWIGKRCPQEHVAALICGVIWLVELLASSLLRLPGVEYVYLFIRFAGDQNGVWLLNKAVLSVFGLVLWGRIALFTA